MIIGSITKEWSTTNGRWMYMRHYAYEWKGDVKLELITGWSKVEVEEKTEALQKAVAEAHNG